METTPFFVGASGSMEPQLQRLVAFKTAAAILQEQYLPQQQQEHQQREGFVMETCTWDPPSFRVEDLLDFPPDESSVAEEAVIFTPSSSSPRSPSTCQIPLQHKQVDVAAASPYAQEDQNGLCPPPDELADQLEWLSAFHEDSSYSCDSALVSIVTKCTDNTSSPSSFLEPPPDSDCLTTAIANSNCLLAAIANFEDETAGTALVPSRARSKRLRSNGGPRTGDILIPMAEDNTVFISGGGSDPGAEKASASAPGLIPNGRGSAWWRQSSTFPLLPQQKPPQKGKKIKLCGSSADGSPPRRCSHCLVQKTPQWRTGPLGPKTLCNACGVRYKSGRLVPEYRPASSPSYVNDMHSNSHRRILEMRRMKEAETHAIPASAKSSDCASQVEEERCHSQTAITSCVTSSTQSLPSQKASDVGEGEEQNSVAVCSEGIGSAKGALAANGTWRDEKEESINSSVSSSA